MNQLVLLPLQQQLLLRKMLEAKVSDIDLQVASAARTEWNNRFVVSTLSPSASDDSLQNE